MRFLNRVVIIALLLSMLMLAKTSSASPAQQSPVTFKNPLAYIGEDGNVYVTDSTSGRGQPITGDAGGGRTSESPFIRRTLNYGGLTWSSDGRILAFVETFQNNSVIVVESGKTPVVVTKNADSRFPPTFSPDGKEVAWVVGTPEQDPETSGIKLQIQAASVGGGAPRAVGTIVGDPWPCAGDVFDPAAIIHFYDVGMMTAYPLYLKWLEGNRFLHSMGCNGVGVALSTAVADVWKNPSLVSPALSPDGTQLLAVLTDQQGANGELQLVDLETGEMNPLETQPGVDRAIFSADGKSIIYVTKQLAREIKGNATAAVGQQLMEISWPYEGTEYTLVLWTMPVEGGTSTAIFKDVGFGIGYLSASPDEPLVAFSLTGSMGKMIDAINAGDSVDEVVALAPRNRIITAATDIPALPNVVTEGGDPAYSPSDEFAIIPAQVVAAAPTLVVVPTLVTVATQPPLPTAIPFTSTPAPTAAIVLPVGGRCPGFLPSRLVVGGRGRVIPGGQWNRLRESPPSGTVLTQIPSGEVFNVLEGPVCTSNNIAWWKVNFRGTIGWTAEGQNSVYWLEPYTDSMATTTGATATTGGATLTPTSTGDGTFGIVGVTAHVSPSSTTTCPATFNFTGQIVVNRPGTVTYRWERSDGATGPVLTWTAVAGALTKDEATSWTLGGAGSTGTFWERIHVLTPNNIYSNQATFTLSC